jgi:UDP-glucose 4-epimerase
MEYILLGGNGYLGTVFRKGIDNSKHRVIVVGREDIDLHDAVYFSIRRYSLEQIRQVAELSQDAIVVDFAYSTVPQTSFDNPVKDFSENLSAVIRHLEFALTIKAFKYIYISSGGTVYGNNSKKLINEESLTTPISPYGISKLACERYVCMYHTAYGLNTCIVRPSNIYGVGQKPNRGQGFISTALALAHENKPVKVFGDGSKVRDYLYVDDFCKALFQVITKGEFGKVYNVGSGNGHSVNEVIQVINEIICKEGRNLEVEYLPERPFDVNYNVLD